MTPPVPAISKVCEVRSTGAARANGGWFDSSYGGTDYSQQDTAQLHVTDAATINGASNTDCIITSATGGFTAAMAGNGVGIVNDIGNNWNGSIGIVTQVVDANTIHIYSSQVVISGAGGGIASAGSLYIGGAISDPDFAIAFYGFTGNGDKIWVKGSFDYADGKAWGAATNETQPVVIEGYGSVRGDGGSFTLRLTAFDNFQLKINADEWILKNCILNGNGNADVGLEQGYSACQFENLEIKNCTQWGILESAGNNTYRDCLVHDNGDTPQLSPGFPSSGGINSYGQGNTFIRCKSYNNVGPGIYFDDDMNMDRCISYGNQGCGLYIDFGAHVITNFDAYNNDLAGICLDGAGVGGQVLITDSILSQNGTYGAQHTSELADVPNMGEVWLNVAYYNNTLSARSNLPEGVGEITLTQDPFADAAAGNFALNNTAGGGADLKAAATTPNLDIGAEQSVCSGGGGGGGMRTYGGVG